jgi:hypothetical protein
VEPFDPSAKLKEYVNAMLSGRYSASDVIELFRRIRHVIEQDRARTIYPHLSLYCDWLQHIEIDRHAQGLKVLQAINDRLITGWSRPDEMLVRDISEAIGLGPLRTELGLLFMSKGIPTKIVDSSSSWRRVLSVLVQDVCERPIRLPLRSANKKGIFDKLKEKWEKAGIDAGPVRALFLELQETAGVDGTPAGYYWNMELCGEKLVGAEAVVFRGQLLHRV